MLPGVFACRWKSGAWLAGDAAATGVPLAPGGGAGGLRAGGLLRKTNPASARTAFLGELTTIYSSLSHSLCYFYLQLPDPNQELPQFFINSYLDDQPIAQFDSLTRRMEPLVPWMEEVEKKRFLIPEWVFRPDLEKLSKVDQHAGGLHTWQAIWGCELREDGSKGGYFHYGYNGIDFISFDKETLRWVAAQAQAQKVKEKWDEDPGWTKKMKIYLEKTCIEWLQRYLFYKKEVLQRIEPPVGILTHKVVDESLEVLICQAFGFYPKEIQAIWRRDGEAFQYETLHKNVTPNSDGTYYIQISIEIDPKERDRFWWHEGLQEPLVLALKEETATIWWILVAALILANGILFLSCWRCRKNRHWEVTSFSRTASFSHKCRRWDSVVRDAPS
ncbi:major histocompatibility complex class I-related gene protein-like [Ahaetulla prasina]|uniref:major histocompatibility complex class I-related gene protein-like n=1 Tax=Ahaetulla prasina TaxID=499056 RepID=UPI0026480F91|nr:major histocompatibility complex class I-related gene protein-like [Ahaetulla prasina]